MSSTHCPAGSGGRLSARAAPASLVMLLALACTAAGCNRSPPAAPARPPAAATVMTITSQDVPVSFEFVAQTQSSREVNIQARVNGFLDRRVYTEGSKVKEGQVLFLMDKKPFQAQLDQAKAVLQQQQSAMDVAQANLARVKPLVEQNALSQKDLDDATGQYKQSAAAVEQAKAQVVTAQLNLSYCTITSPVNGISGSAQQADGTYIGSSNSLLTTVAVLSPMWVNFSISENQFQSFRQQVQKGLLRPPPNRAFVVEAELVDGTTLPATGQITFLEPEYDTKTGTFMVRSSVENKLDLLRPNQFLHARVTGAVRPNAILVPQRAVQQGPKGHFVWVIDQESKAQPRPITVGDWHGDDWFVNEGLRAGERVVVDGALSVTPGAVVQATEYAPGAAKTAPQAAAAPAK